MPEVDFVLRYHPRSVLDAGCGTGLAAIELSQRGIDVVGVDINPEMLAKASAATPYTSRGSYLTWIQADLASVQLNRTFDVILMAGNVIIYLTRGTEEAVIRNMTRHLTPTGRLITGFQISMDHSYITLEEYDELARAAGLTLQERYSSWTRDPWRWDSPFAVSIHTLAARSPQFEVPSLKGTLP
jgi:predicted TPR repeat methyltransferase